MSNLFSSFDPVSWMGLPMNWLSSMTALALLPAAFWLTPSPLGVILSKVTSTIVSEFKFSLNPKSVPGILLISLSLMVYIALNNSCGLTPYLFTASSHLSFTLALGLPLWLGHMILSVVKAPTLALAHLVPLGTPAGLVPFMVIVEMVSSLIRPITLAVRLAANMIAGHLLMTLMGSQGAAVNTGLLTLVLTGLVLLATLECAVSLIQAYVFSVLSTLYLNEVNSPFMS